MASKSYPRLKNSDTMNRCIALLIAQGENPRKAKSRVGKMSRQRMFQIMWMAQGLCAICRKPLGRSTSRCDACLKKSSEAKRGGSAK